MDESRRGILKFLGLAAVTAPAVAADIKLTPERKSPKFVTCVSSGSPEPTVIGYVVNDDGPIEINKRASYRWSAATKT